MSLIVSVRGGRAEVRRSEDNLPYLICEGESQEFALDASFRACAKRKAAMDVTLSHDPKAPEGTDLYAEAEAEPKAKAKKEKEEPDVELPAA